MTPTTAAATLMLAVACAASGLDAVGGGKSPVAAARPGCAWAPGGCEEVSRAGPADANGALAKLASASCTARLAETKAHFKLLEAAWANPWSSAILGKCPSVNVLNLTAGVLALAAVPKAGSTTMRHGIIQHGFPDYVNHGGEHKGEENAMQPCGKQRQDVLRRVQGRTGEANVFSAITVREPLSRFISGVREEFTNHCYDLPRWGLGLRCGAWVANKPGGEAWGGRSAKEQSLLDREWNTTAFVEQYLEWEAEGFMNDHTVPEAFFARAAFELPPSPPRHKGFLAATAAAAATTTAAGEAGAAAGGKAAAAGEAGFEKAEEASALSLGAYSGAGHAWDAIVRLEHSEDWAFVVDAVEVPTLPRTLMKLYAKPALSEFTLSPRAWGLFCAIHAVDYVCLPYDPPPQCRGNRVVRNLAAAGLSEPRPNPAARWQRRQRA